MTLFDALFSSRTSYEPSLTVEHRLDRNSYDLEALRSVLDFVTEAIREERVRLQEREAHAQQSEETLIWPEAA